MSENKVVKVTVENDGKTSEYEFETFMYAGVNNGEIGTGLSRADHIPVEIMEEKLDSMLAGIVYMIARTHRHVETGQDLLSVVTSVAMNVISQLDTIETTETKGDVQ